MTEPPLMKSGRDGEACVKLLNITVGKNHFKVVGPQANAKSGPDHRENFMVRCYAGKVMCIVRTWRPMIIGDLQTHI